MAGPQDRDREPPHGSRFDAVWGEIADREAAAADAGEPERGGGSDRTKAWDDSARAPVVSSPAQAEAEPEPAHARTRVADAGQIAKAAQEAAAAREMQRLMEGAVGPSRPPLRIVASDDEPDAPARAPVRVHEPAAASAGEGGGNKMLVGLVALAIVVGVGWMIVREPATPRTSPALAEAAPGAPIPAKAGPRAPSEPARTPMPAVHADQARDPAPDEHGSTGALEAGDDAGEPDARPSGTAPTSASVDPREPPPGTPAELAAEFRRLPVSAADRPPVGGVGAGGIHVDRIWMGSEYDGDCKGPSDRFSVSGEARPSVCIRVVHPREKDEVSVVWEKQGGGARRGKLTIKPTHAYRTRAYLVLRREDVGDWTVRILSRDGVELASHAFQVVE